MTTIRKSIAWVAGAQTALGILDVVSTIICVRWFVTKADFGIATIAIALFPIVDRLGGMGFGAALIRDPEDEDSAFWTNLVIAAALTGCLAIVPSVIATLLAAYAARGIVMAIGMVPEARMRRALRFDELAVIRVIAGVVDNSVKIAAAAAGQHIWCFVLGPIANTIVTTILIQAREHYRPRLHWNRAHTRLRFVAALSGGEILYYVYTSADYVVVGAAFGDAAVGVYRLAYELVIDVVRLVSMINAEVAYPVFVKTPPIELPGVFTQFVRRNLLVLVPFFAFVMIASPWLLEALYGPMPPEAATASRILCIVGLLRSIGFLIPPLLAALNAPARVLIYNAVAAVILPACFAIAAHLGHDFVAIAWAWAIGYPIAFATLLALTRAPLSRAMRPAPAP
ncbi:MAG: oligosaccharide flippase family protein [Kofleriaceae bacterium]